MLMQRVITSLILIPLVLLILFYAPVWVLLGIVLLLIIAAGRECWQLIPLQGFTAQVSFLLLLLMGFWLCDAVFYFWLILGLFFWLCIGAAILTFPESQRYWGRPWVVMSACFIVLPLFGHSLLHLYAQPHGATLVLYLLCLVWAADSGAYFAGKLWGVHKLIPQVSPGKSWEGALGGLVFVMLVAFIGYFYFSPLSLAQWLLLAVSVYVVSIFGDLFISILKRRCHVKDTGTLIPGHGGILDRLDSIIAALPFFCWGMTHL